MRVGMRVESISGVDARMHRQTRQDLFGNGNLVGFLTDAHLEQGFLTLMSTEGQQMGRLVLSGGRSAHGFAVEGHGLLVALRTTGLDPSGEHHLEVTHTQAGQEATIERAGGGVEVTWPKEPTRASAAGRDSIVPPLRETCSYRARPPPSR